MKLKTIDLHFFFIPFFVLFMMFAIISHISVKKHIKSVYNTLEKNSLSMTENYTRRIVNSNLAEEIILDLLDEKLSQNFLKDPLKKQIPYKYLLLY